MAELADKILNLLETDCSCCDNDKIWFVGKKFNYLFCMDIFEKKIEIIDRIPGENVTGYRSYIKIVKYKNLLVLIPGYADKVLIYDIPSRLFREIAVGTQKDHIFYVYAGIEQDKLFLLDYMDAILTTIDLLNEGIILQKKIDGSKPEDLIYIKPILEKGIIYIPSYKKNKIVIYNIKEDNFRECYLEGMTSGCSDIIYDGIFFWLIGYEGEIVKWNAETMEILQIINIPKSFKEFALVGNEKEVKWYSHEESGIRNYPFCWDCDYDGKYIWILPSLSNNILCVDKSTGELKILEFLNEDEDTYTMQGREGYKFSFMGINKGRYIRIYSHKNRTIYCVDNMTMDYTEEEWGIKNTSLTKFLDDYWSEPRTENLYEDLGLLIEGLLID